MLLDDRIKFEKQIFNAMDGPFFYLIQFGPFLGIRIKFRFWSRIWIKFKIWAGIRIKLSAEKEPCHPKRA